MTKKILSSLLVVFSVSALTACSGYNEIMRKYLGDKNNYKAITAIYNSYKLYDDYLYIYVNGD